MDALELMWMIFYWGSYLLCFTVYPYLLWYLPMGEFNKFTRFRQAFVSYILYYALLGAVGLLVLGYLLLKSYFETVSIEGFIMALTSAYGLALIMVFLSFGLITVP